MGFLAYVAKEMSSVMVQYKKTHISYASVQNYKISLRDKHIFQEK